MHCHPTAGNWRLSQCPVPSVTSAPTSSTLGIYSVSSGAELRAWTAPTKITSGLGGSTLTWLSGGRQLVFNASEFTASSAYYSQLRTLDVTATGTDLMADSRPLLTVNNSGASTCLSLQITPDGKAAICATQYAFVTGSGSNAGCANGGLKFIAFPLPAPKPSRVLYQYRGACHNGESFTLWTDASASFIIGVTGINVDNEGGKEAVQVGVITGGRFRRAQHRKERSPGQLRGPPRVLGSSPPAARSSPGVTLASRPWCCGCT